VEKKMKKIILLLAIALLVLMSNKEMIGQDCPSGWQQRIVTGYPQCPDAQFIIEVCCPISGGVVQFRFIRVDGCSAYYLPSVMDWLSARVRANYFELCGVWVPCIPGPPKDVYILIPLCFYENDEKANDFLFCDVSWCKEHWTVCDLGGGNLDWNQLSKEIIGDPFPQCLNNMYSEELPRGTCFKVEDCQ
jgi:hypothetical protein